MVYLLIVIGLKIKDLQKGVYIRRAGIKGDEKMRTSNAQQVFICTKIKSLY